MKRFDRLYKTIMEDVKSSKKHLIKEDISDDLYDKVSNYVENDQQFQEYVHQVADEYDHYYTEICGTSDILDEIYDNIVELYEGEEGEEEFEKKFDANPFEAITSLGIKNMIENYIKEVMDDGGIDYDDACAYYYDKMNAVFSILDNIFDPDREKKNDIQKFKQKLVDFIERDEIELVDLQNYLTTSSNWNLTPEERKIFYELPDGGWMWDNVWEGQCEDYCDWDYPEGFLKENDLMDFVKYIQSVKDGDPDEEYEAEHPEEAAKYNPDHVKFEFDQNLYEQWKKGYVSWRQKKGQSTTDEQALKLYKDLLKSGGWSRTEEKLAKWTDEDFSKNLWP